MVKIRPCQGGRGGLLEVVTGEKADRSCEVVGR